MPPDYSDQNLQGRSFKGQNLTGANFRNADIRGADFTDAILKDADFKGAKAGLPKRWVIALLIFTSLLALLAGFLSGECAWILNDLFQALSHFVARFIFKVDIHLMYLDEINSLSDLIFGRSLKEYVAFFHLIFLFIILIVGLRAGIRKALEVAGIISIFFLGFISIWLTYFSSYYNTGQYISGLSFTIVWFTCIMLLMPVAVATSIDIAGLWAGRLITCLGVSIATASGFDFVFNQYGGGGRNINNVGSEYDFAVISTGVLAGILILLSSYIVKGAFTGNIKYVLVRQLTIIISATGGTSFRSADLTNADFTGANLKNTDFRKANLTRTRFYEAKKLDFARVGDTILSNRNVLNLLITNNGRGKSFAGKNLKGANLIGADLKEANLKDTDISEATFQRANLEYANLALTQAINTNFTSAQMTGACIEAWNIDSTTKLDNVDCRFVYLLENPKLGTDDRERRPSSGEFKPGEFTKLFEEVLNTIDLIFRDGIDWKAFVAAFKKAQVENEDQELAIQSIENKGDGVIIVKVAVSVDADKEKVHSDFTRNYQIALQAIEEKYKDLLQAKDEQIVIYRQQSAEMKEIVTMLAKKPVNVQIDNKLENKNMTNSNDSSRKIEIGSVGGDFNASGQALNLGDISGTVTNTINELPASAEPEKPGIKELLTQLQTAIEAEENLTLKNKEKALKQLKALAEASQNPNDEEKKDLADTAITMLKGLISGLPTAATSVETCSKLFPIISKFLGIG